MYSHLNVPITLKYRSIKNLERVDGSRKSSVYKLLNTIACLANQNLEERDFALVGREGDFEGEAVQMCSIVP